jgi:hypothetical protein
MIRVAVLCSALMFSRFAHAASAVSSCATCHAAQAKEQPQTSMGRALESVENCSILKTHAILSYASGPYRYRITREGDRSIYTVADGKQTITAPISWAFGLGAAGQTYVYAKDGKLYQSRVSYYRDIDGLAPTLGATNANPADLTDAAGQLMAHDDQVACFGCHATHAVDRRQLTFASLVPGVQCERCHAGAAEHLSAMQNGRPSLAGIEDLRKYSTEQISNFCGQCHRTWEDIAVSGIHGVVNVRFQPYRLTNSKCYDAADPRISCTACHDPHVEIDRVDGDYDSKCLACHAGAKPKGVACKVSQTNCVSCHMPKIEIPGAHHRFTDHDIRIARANAPYPD